MTDEHQPEQLTVPTLQAVIVSLLRQLGMRGEVFSAREMREGRLTELVVVTHKNGTVSVGVGSER